MTIAASDIRVGAESFVEFQGQSQMKKYNVGDKVVKNPETWIPNDFDSWGRGIGVGVVVEAPFDVDDDEADVRWPAGRCFEKAEQLLPYSDEKRKETND